MAAGVRRLIHSGRRSAGYVLLLMSLPSLLSMTPIPDIRGAIKPGGLVGSLVSHGLQSGFNLLAQ